MKKLIVLGCLILALGVSLVLVARRDRAAMRTPAAQDASLLLLRATNLSTGTLAMFRLTNGTKVHIACVPEAIEQAGAGGWSRMPLTGRARRPGRDWAGVQEDLQPGAAFTFLVPPPTNGAPWRVVFMCQEQAQVIDPLANTVRHLTDTNAMKTQVQQFSGRRYYVTSPEVGD